MAGLALALRLLIALNTCLAPAAAAWAQGFSSTADVFVQRMAPHTSGVTGRGGWVGGCQA